MYAGKNRKYPGVEEMNCCFNANTKTVNKDLDKDVASKSEISQKDTKLPSQSRTVDLGYSETEHNPI
jgi:hypothetical protein